MLSWADQTLATLRPNYPEWDMWYVPSYPKGQTWHARPKGAPVATIHAESPEVLIAAIAEQEAAR